MPTVTCPYCGTSVPADDALCPACGAPVTVERPALPPVQPRLTVPTPPKPVALPKQTDAVVEAGHKVYSVYYHFWRAVADILIIALVAFSLGLIGAAVGLPVAGIIAALLAAGTVVVTTHRILLVTFFTPLAGLLLGSLIWVCPWTIGAGPKGMVFTAALFTMGATRLWAIRTYWRGWDWVRLVLGLVEALIFGLLGILLAAAMHWAAGLLGS